MEKRVFIEKQFPLEERSYRDRNNEERVLPIRAFVLNDGLFPDAAKAMDQEAAKKLNDEVRVMNMNAFT